MPEQNRRSSRPSSFICSLLENCNGLLLFIHLHQYSAPAVHMMCIRSALSLSCSLFRSQAILSPFSCGSCRQCSLCYLHKFSSICIPLAIERFLLCGGNHPQWMAMVVNRKSR